MTIIEKSSGEASIMLAPKKWWSEPQPERERLIKRGISLHGAAWRMIDPVKIENPETRRAAAKALANEVAMLVCINLEYLLYGKLLAENNGQPVAITPVDGIEDNIIASSEEEADDLIWNATLRHGVKKIEPGLTEAFATDTVGIKILWRHVIFRTLVAVEENHGAVEKFQKGEITKAEFDLLFDQYLGSHQALLEASVFYAGSAARSFLEEMDPLSWPAEVLMEFLNLKYASGFGLGSISLSQSQVERLIKEVLKAIPLSLDVKYDVRDGKNVVKIETSGFKLELEVEAEAIGLKQMFEPALLAGPAKPSQGGARNIKVAKLPEETRKALGKRYEELRDSLTKVRKDAKAAIEFSGDNWRNKLLDKYPIFKVYPELLDEVDPYRAPSDSEASDKTMDPWQIAMEIAAREIVPGHKDKSTSPDAKGKDKRASADALRRIAILPDRGNR
jgi:hypothetical protein